MKKSKQCRRIKYIAEILLTLLIMSGCGKEDSNIGVGLNTNDSINTDVSMSTNDNANINITETIYDGADADNTNNQDTDNIYEENETDTLITKIELTDEEQQKLDIENSQKRQTAAKPYEDEIRQVMLDLYTQNPHVIGYIRVEGMDVDCPVMQSIENYDFYLTHDIDGNESKQGCIILDPDSEIGIGTKENGYLAGYGPSTNQLVHGHNMKKGTMFGALDRYANEEFADEHPYIYFDSLYEERIYEVVLSFYSRVYPKEEEVFKYYNFNNAASEEEFNDWLNNISKLALYQRTVDIKYGDEMITLSTCAYQEEDGRFAVIGKRIK